MIFHNYAIYNKQFNLFPKKIEKQNKAKINIINEIEYTADDWISPTIGAIGEGIKKINLTNKKAQKRKGSGVSNIKFIL